MLKNYLKLILRRISSNPLISIVSFIGLSIGFTAILLVAGWLKNELNYDNFYENGKNLYRLTVEVENKETGFHWDFARSHMGWLRHAKEEIPGVEDLTRFMRWSKGVIKVGDESWQEEIFEADANLPEIFSLVFIEGERESCLKNQHSVILSESYARNYFGTEEAIDKTVYLYSNYTTEKTPYRVTGVFRDFPANAHVHFNIVASNQMHDQDMFWAYYYVLLAENTSTHDILSNFGSFAEKYREGNGNEILNPKLQSVRDIHLQSNKDRELEKNGSMVQIKIIAALGFFVLIITLFNFFNLRYTLLLKDHKPFQVFRLAGARTKGIIGFQMLEITMYALMSAGISLIIVITAYPYLNQLMGAIGSFNLQANIFPYSGIILFLIMLTVLIGLLPTFFSRAVTKIISALPGSFQGSAQTKAVPQRSNILKILVGMQYLAGFILIIAVLVINGQIRLFMESSLGNNKEKLVCITGVPVQAVNKYQVFKQELLANPLILDVTSSMENPGCEIRDMMSFKTTGLNTTNNKLVYVSPVDYNFFDFYDIPLVAGNNFPEYKGDDSLPESFILNEKAVEYLGWDIHEAIGRPFSLTNQFTSKEGGKIVGVVKDFQPSTMKEEIRPYVYFQKSFWLFSAQIRYDTTRTGESLAYIQDTWKTIYPDHPLSYEYVDNLYQEIYKGEFQLRNMSMLLCILALILSGTGLFGITSITYEARTKEIGIRKVNGASIQKVIHWLLNDILQVVFIVIVIAIPLSYLLTSFWLKGYVYRITPNLSIYLIAGLGLIGLAILTVGWQTWKAASKNPVDSLRYE